MLTPAVSPAVLALETPDAALALAMHYAVSLALSAADMALLIESSLVATTATVDLHALTGAADAVALTLALAETATNDEPTEDAATATVATNTVTTTLDAATATITVSKDEL